MSPESDHDIWREEVKTFIKTNYNVDKVTCPHIGKLFNGHGTPGYACTSTGVSYSYLRNVFNRQKGKKPPSKEMKLAFLQLKDIQARGALLTFPYLMLRGHTHPVFPVEVLAIFHMWSLTYKDKLSPVTYPVITKDSPRSVVERWAEMFLRYCKGRFQIDTHSLFVSNNIEIFQYQYLKYVERVTPKNEGPIIS